MDAHDSLLRDFLVDSGLVSRSGMSDALERIAKEENPSLTAALADAGLLGRDDLRRATSHAVGVPFVEVHPSDVLTEAMILIPEPMARSRGLFAYNLQDGALEVAALDLRDINHLGDIARGRRVLPRLTSEASMRRLLLHYQKYLKEKFGDLFAAGQHLTDALIKHAVFSRAGAVHIEPSHLGTLVRYQIGHALHEAFTPPGQTGKQLVAQPKSFAKLLPVARPQEGKFKVGLSGQEHEGEVVNVRVHTLPSEGGERVHVRLARGSSRGYTLESLGFHGEGLEAVERFLSRRRGLLAVLGEEGSGKSTLLHTLADLLASPHLTLVRLGGGSEALSTMRAALRHDPDVVLIDDLRDEALVALAQTAASRGVLVIASMKYDAPAMTPDLVVEIVRVRRLCTKAFHDSTKLSRGQAHALEASADFTRLLAALKDEHVVAPALAWKDVSFARATPCSECKQGYAGHVGLHQVIERGVLAGLSLVEDGLFKAAQGLTSLDEAMRLVEAPLQ